MFDNNKFIDFICNLCFVAMWVGFIAIGAAVILGISFLIKWVVGL